MKHLLIILLALFITGLSYAADEDESIELTTYYPAPYGDYDGLTTNNIQITGGTPGAGKVLTSGADGVGTWQDAPGGQLGNYGAELTLGGPLFTSAAEEITPVLALTDGFVVAYSETITGHGCIIEGYTDSNLDPTTLVAQEGHPDNELGDRHCITFPVKKGNYWKIRITRGDSRATYRWISFQ